MLAVTAAGLASLVVVDASLSEHAEFVPADTELVVERLVAVHGCWTSSNAPAGVIPGHALVTLPGREPALVPSDRGFGIWLDGDPGVLHAFCP